MTDIEDLEDRYAQACIEYVDQLLAGAVPLGSREHLGPASDARQHLLEALHDRQVDEERLEHLDRIQAYNT